MVASAEAETKKSSQSPDYTLLYHPGLPGRGEFIRLVFEAAGVAFFDPANESKAGTRSVYSLLGPDVSHDEGANPPPFAPPMLKVSGRGKGGKDLLIFQTPNILLYLGEQLGLNGSDAVDRYHVNEMALTALDLCNEAHDTHHPVAVAKYYEEQKEESLKKAADFRELRIPKFLGYFEKVLQGNSEGGGHYLVGRSLTYADTTLWNVLDGLFFAFPKEMAAQKAKLPGVLETFYNAVKQEERIATYLEGSRRLKFSNGIFRHYPELDRQD